MGIGHTRRGTRSWAIILALVAVLAVTLAACGSGDGGGAAGGTAADQTVGEGIQSGENARQGGDLKVGLPGVPASLDPTLSTRGGNYIFGTYSETLTNFDLEGKLTKDGLLTDWERPDENTWRFTLREGVTFHNGEPFDAKAAAYTILAQRDTEGAILATYFQNIDDVEVVDPTTIDVKTKTPQFNIPDQLGTVYAIPPKAYEEQGADFAKKPIGTGPFVFDGQRAGQSARVTANEEYWRGRPKLDSITFSFPKDAAQRLALVQSGALDLAFELSHTQAEEADNAGLQVLSVPTSLKQVAFVVEKGPLEDPDVRKAAALAIDRKAIVEGIFNGTNTAEGGFLNTLPGQDVPQVLEPDMEEAKRLLAGKSPEITLSWVAGFNTGIDEVTSAIRSQLEEAGFKVNPNPTDVPTLLGQVLQRKINGIWVYGIAPNVPDPNFYVQGLMTSKSLSANCPRQEWDQKAVEALTLEDAEAAQPIYDELNTDAVVSEACYVPIYFETSHFAAAPNVGGFTFSPLRYSDFYEAGFVGEE